MPSMSTEMKTLRGRPLECAIEAERRRATPARANMTAHFTRISQGRPERGAPARGRANRGWMAGPPCRAAAWSASLLAGEEGFLSRHTPAVPACSARRGHDAVARDGERDRIGGTRTSDGAHRLRTADRRGDLAIGPRLAVRNLRERLPHLPLERRGLHVERQIQCRPAAGE